MRGTSFKSAGHRARPRAAAAPLPPLAAGVRPRWADVEARVEELSATRTTFVTTTSPSNWISACEPARRFMLETDGRSRWIQMDHVRECWETFERLGRITREDVLEPGRSSAVMLGLFAQVPGVVAEDGALAFASRPAGDAAPAPIG